MRDWLTKHRAEILTAACWLTGWALLTWAVVAGISGAWATLVWRTSLALLLVSLGGWKPLKVWLTHGVYSLTRGGK